MDTINLPKPQETKAATNMPGPGCRKLTPMQAYKYTNKYGVEKIHVDFDYNGYKFGQNFKENSHVLYKLFNGVIDNTKMGTPIWAEVVLEQGKITGKQYPTIVDSANEF